MSWHHNDRAFLLIAGGIVLLLFVAGAFMAANDITVGGGSPPAATTPPAPDQIGAFVACQEFVKRRLKAPASADFPCCASDFVTGGPSAFHVRSYVDAQNAFGAKLRTGYSCDVHEAGGQWLLDSISIQ